MEKRQFCSTTTARFSLRARAFNFALAPLEIASFGPQYQKWYMDDGGIIGSVEVLRKVWQLLKEKGPALGLKLNPAKCEWSWVNSRITAECPLKEEGVSLVPTSEVCILGVPLGSAEFCSKFVKRNCFLE